MASLTSNNINDIGDFLDKTNILEQCVVEVNVRKRRYFHDGWTEVDNGPCLKFAKQ